MSFEFSEKEKDGGPIGPEETLRRIFEKKERKPKPKKRKSADVIPFPGQAEKQD